MAPRASTTTVLPRLRRRVGLPRSSMAPTTTPSSPRVRTTQLPSHALALTMSSAKFEGENKAGKKGGKEELGRCGGIRSKSAFLSNMLPASGLGIHCDLTIDTWVRFESTQGEHPIMNEDNWDFGDLHYQVGVGPKARAMAFNLVSAVVNNIPHVREARIESFRFCGHVLCAH